MELPTDLLTVEEVAAELRVKPKTLLNWRSGGIGPRGFRMGGAVRYRRAEVHRWLAEQESASQEGLA